MSLWYLNENPLRSVLCNEHKNVHILYPTVHILINSYGTLVWYLIVFVSFMKTIHYTMVHVGTSSGFRRTSTVDRKENIALFLRACKNFKVKVSPEVCLYWSLENLKTSKLKPHSRSLCFSVNGKNFKVKVSPKVFYIKKLWIQKLKSHLSFLYKKNFEIPKLKSCLSLISIDLKRSKSKWDKE